MATSYQARIQGGGTMGAIAPPSPLEPSQYYISTFKLRGKKYGEHLAKMKKKEKQKTKQNKMLSYRTLLNVYEFVSIFIESMKESRNLGARVRSEDRKIHTSPHYVFDLGKKKILNGSRIV